MNCQYLPNLIVSINILPTITRYTHRWSGRRRRQSSYLRIRVTVIVLRLQVFQIDIYVRAKVVVDNLLADPLCVPLSQIVSMKARQFTSQLLLSHESWAVYLKASFTMLLVVLLNHLGSSGFNLGFRRIPPT